MVDVNLRAYTARHPAREHAGLLTFFLSYTPAAFSTSAAMGTVELTGLLMMFKMACRQHRPPGREVHG